MLTQYFALSTVKKKEEWRVEESEGRKQEGKGRKQRSKEQDQDMGKEREMERKRN